jgi:hypothetical protein
VDVLAAPEARELAVLQHLQELRLQRWLHLADLVEEHRPLMRELELAGLVLDGAREGAALEAEELGLEQFAGQSRAVDLDEDAVTAGRGAVNGAGDELLAGAALPRMSTVTSVSATRSMRWRTSRIFSLVPSSSPSTRGGRVRRSCRERSSPTRASRPIMIATARR